MNRTVVKNLPVIFCGDFNAEPSFHEYKLLKEGKLSETELDKLRNVSYEINKENGSSLAVVSLSFIFYYVKSEGFLSSLAKPMNSGLPILTVNFVFFAKKALKMSAIFY